MTSETFSAEHLRWTRRYFLRAGVGAGAIAAWSVTALKALQGASAPARSRELDKKGAQPEPYFTSQDDFGDVSRGTPLPHSLPEAKKREVGLHRETWKLEVISDPEQPARLGKQLTKADGSALDFAALLKLGEKHAVRFPKVMTCLNVGCPLGMGIWEGVPLREVVALAQPRSNLRRVFYYGYHNDDPKQLFRSSLPISRVLEDPHDFPPVILCYKLNGQWLNSERGGPVRVVVPEAYGFKSIKWLSHLVLTNLAHANDTYAEQNNDVESPLKTFAASLSVPLLVKAGEKIAVSGYAQVGVSGLSKVQVSIISSATPPAESDPYFQSLPWVDAELLKAPKALRMLAGEMVPAGTTGFDDSGEPKSWPMKLTKAHWAAVLPSLPVGEYTFRCRSIDEKGNAQPLPRASRQSGHAAIESVEIEVKD